MIESSIDAESRVWFQNGFTKIREKLGKKEDEQGKEDKSSTISGR